MEDASNVEFIGKGKPPGCDVSHQTMSCQLTLLVRAVGVAYRLLYGGGDVLQEGKYSGLEIHMVLGKSCSARGVIEMRKIFPLHNVPASYGYVAQRLPTRGVTQRFGNKLRFLRKSKNMTQLQMSIYLGINRSYISELERGLKSISLPMMEVVALGFGLNLSDLLRDI